MFRPTHLPVRPLNVQTLPRHSLKVSQISYFLHQHQVQSTRSRRPPRRASLRPSRVQLARPRPAAPSTTRAALSFGRPLYSDRSNVLLRIVEDTVGTHDFLLMPCSKDSFRIIYGDKESHRGCFGNLTAPLDHSG
ncbi:hypothetical protein DFH07DRAFT_38985 [Mycena maculata]|uniref:DUF1989 domain-containing protein n=1 Tax=Mycena maculata TaxID=230809 RepID=A0AAD7IIK4_9AGAR|nr:hypothetical protein DFH07DRAFT_38985 [Mycena maculata]